MMFGDLEKLAQTRTCTVEYDAKTAQVYVRVGDVILALDRRAFASMTGTFRRSVGRIFPRAHKAEAADSPLKLVFDRDRGGFLDEGAPEPEAGPAPKD